jgi:GNAT superfamily N-acetyltransferase
MPNLPVSSANIRSNHVAIRPAVPSDVPSLFNLIMALAEYEQLAHEVVGTIEALHEHLFGSSCIEALVAECDGQAVGFALYFVNYSTFLTQPGLYLEDLFVLPHYRGVGVGKALLATLAKLALERGYGRLEWSVLDWNEPAIGFYKRIGAQITEDARICRVTGNTLSSLANELMLSIKLRPMATNDIENVFALVRANIEHDGGLPLFAGSKDALADHLLNQLYAEVVIAEQNNRTVGLALFCTTYSTFLTKPGLFIEDLFVLPQYRGQGIGRSMLAYLAQQVLDRNYGRLEWRVRTWNQRAIDFYQRLGAVILPDWRVCQLYQDEMEQLAGCGRGEASA